jgi:hypothetical protein
LVERDSTRNSYATNIMFWDRNGSTTIMYLNLLQIVKMMVRACIRYMVQNFSFRKISAFTEITEFQWISVISVFSSAKWPKFSLEIHQKNWNFEKYFVFYLNSCVLLKWLKLFDRMTIISVSTEITEIQWISMRFHWKLFPWFP